MSKSVKLVAVGDPTVGKSSIFISFTSSGFLKDYVPTTFDNFNKELITEQGLISLSLWDTAGQDELANLRQLSYAQADVVLLVFSTILPSSYENITTKWIHEIKQFCPNAPFMLVGSKTDMRDTFQGEVITSAKGKELARQIGAIGYVECSAMTHDGLDNVFNKTLETLSEKKVKGARITKKDKCAVM